MNNKMNNKMNKKTNNRMNKRPDNTLCCQPTVVIRFDGE